MMTHNKDVEQKAGSSHAAGEPALDTPIPLKRLIDMKKSYEFWRSLKGKDTRLPMLSNKMGENGAKGAGPKGIAAPGKSAVSGKVSGASGMNLLFEKDLSFLRNRLDEIVQQNSIDLEDGEVEKLLQSCVSEAEMSQGFDPYGTKDEEGLHSGNTMHSDGQEDYDVEEIEEEEFQYDYGPTHHIEVELNDGTPREGSPDPNEPSCEFTFEYDRDGKLIPTSNNIEEKLRLLSLQSKLALEPGTAKKKKGAKKNNKKRDDDHFPGVLDDCACLFCQYEAFYGVRPIHTMKWYDDKMAREEAKRTQIKRKLENAKITAWRRTRQRESEREHMDDSEGSHATVEDE